MFKKNLLMLRLEHIFSMTEAVLRRVSNSRHLSSWALSHDFNNTKNCMKRYWYATVCQWYYFKFHFRYQRVISPSFWIHKIEQCVKLLFLHQTPVAVVPQRQWCVLLQQIRRTDNKVYEQSNGRKRTSSSINKHPARRSAEMEKVEKVQTMRAIKGPPHRCHRRHRRRRRKDNNETFGNVPERGIKLETLSRNIYAAT